MTVVYDVYRELEIDRSWGIPDIKDYLKRLRRIWLLKQSVCEDKTQRLAIDRVLCAVDDACRWLIEPDMREQYDEALEEAYKDGRITDVDKKFAETLVEKAGAYYRKSSAV